MDHELLRKPRDQIRYPDHRELLNITTQLRQSGQNELALEGQIRVALALERSRVPYREKALQWEGAALLAEELALPRSKFLTNAAEHLASDGAPLKAASLFAKAYECASNEDIQFENKIALLRGARTNYEAAGYSEEAVKHFIEEKDLYLAISPWYEKVWMLAFRFVSLYGESPIRVVLASGIVIVGCALVYTFLGLSVDGSTVAPVHFLSSLYFSVVTFTTLGYGDYAPPSGLGRAVAAMEAMTGLFLMSLFLVTLVRKFGRS